MGGFAGIGVFEIILVMLIAVLVLGPERIPEFAVQIARAVKYLRGFATDSTRELREEFDDLMKEYEGMREELRELRGSVEKDTTQIGEDIEGAKQEVRGATKEIDRTVAQTGPIIEPGGDLPPKPAGEEDGDQNRDGR